jgi:hypothetical protein
MNNFKKFEAFIFSNKHNDHVYLSFDNSTGGVRTQDLLFVGGRDDPYICHAARVTINI